MNITKLLCAAAGAALVSVGAAHAQWKPTKTVDVIVHTGPGGGSDLLARAIATMMEKEKLLPVRMQVINKPGGNGAVAAAAVAERKDDPNTLALVTSVWIAGPLTSSEAKVALTDLKPIACLVFDPAVFGRPIYLSGFTGKRLFLRLSGTRSVCSVSIFSVAALSAA